MIFRLCILSNGANENGLKSGLSGVSVQPCAYLEDILYPSLHLLLHVK